MSRSRTQSLPRTEHQFDGAAQEVSNEIVRLTADDLSEECNRQAAELRAAPAETQRLFTEFRRKLATGEAVSRALAKLAEALCFSGRITITFHQGKITKTVLEESYFRGHVAM